MMFPRSDSFTSTLFSSSTLAENGDLVTISNICKLKGAMEKSAGSVAIGRKRKLVSVPFFNGRKLSMCTARPPSTNILVLSTRGWPKYSPPQAMLNNNKSQYKNN